MEGTRHEKIAIVLLSYVIGFTTAFIAFGVNQVSKPQTIVVYNQLTASEVSTTPFEVAEDTISSVGLGDEGLFAVTSGYERLLSANQKNLPASAIEGTNLSGFFYNIIDAEASRDGKFVYFCEQLSEDAQTCDPYVYSLADDSLHAVLINGEVYVSPIESHDSSWTQTGTLVLNGMESATSQTPWVIDVVAQ